MNDLHVYQPSEEKSPASDTPMSTSDKGDYVEKTVEGEVPTDLQLAEHWLNTGEWRHSVRHIIRHLKDQEAK
jgi:hypothetical protein